MEQTDFMLNKGSGCVPLPKLLVLAREKLENIDELFSQSALCDVYRMDCVPNMQESIQVEQYEAVIMQGLSNVELGKLCTGICDTPYTAIASEAILRNMRVYVPIEQIELYRYASSRPNPYYEFMYSRITMLTDSSLVICTMDNIETCILEEYEAGIQKVPSMLTKAPDPDPPVLSPKPREAKETVLTPIAPAARLPKRVITERDLLTAVKNGSSRLLIPANAIVTDAAAEYASARGLTLTRE